MRSAPTNSEVKAGIVEIDRLFSQKSTKNIPLADIHKATSRIYSESMIKLNALNQRLAEIKAIPLPRNANNEAYSRFGILFSPNTFLFLDLMCKNSI